VCARLTARQPLAPAEGRSLTNGDFSAEPLGWPSTGGCAPPLVCPSRWRPRAGDSSQPLRQPGAQLPSAGAGGAVGTRTRLPAAFRVPHVGHPSGLGLRWQAGGNGWSVMGPDLSAEDWTEGQLDFRAPPKAGQALLSLRYDRALGTTRIEGAVWMRNVSLTFR